MADTRFSHLSSTTPTLPVTPTPVPAPQPQQQQQTLATPQNVITTPSPTPSTRVVIVKKKKEKPKKETKPVVEGLGDFGFSCESRGQKLGCLIIELLLVFLFCLPMIIIGAGNLNDCQSNSFVPIWLLVAGMFFLFHGIINGLLKIAGLFDLEENVDHVRRLTIFIVSGIFFVIEVIWLIAGAVAVYSESPVTSSANKGNANYCDAVAWYYAWWLITIIFITVFGGLLFATLVFYCFKTC